MVKMVGENNKDKVNEKKEGEVKKVEAEKEKEREKEKEEGKEVKKEETKKVEEEKEKGKGAKKKEKVVAKDIGAKVSFKKSVEICRFIKGKNVEKVKKLLELVSLGKRAIPYKKYGMEAGHRKVVGSGGYPKDGAKLFIRLLNTLQKNAEHEGMNPNNLLIIEAIANKGVTRWHYGRFRRRKAKSTNIKLVAKEK